LHRAVIIKSVYNEEILVFALAENISIYSAQDAAEEASETTRSDPLCALPFFLAFFSPRND